MYSIAVQHLLALFTRSSKKVRESGSEVTRESGSQGERESGSEGVIWEAMLGLENAPRSNSGSAGSAAGQMVSTGYRIHEMGDEMGDEMRGEE